MIRSATNSDEDAITALVFDVLHDYGLDPDPSTTDADLNNIEGHYISSGGCFDVLEDSSGNIIGSVGLYPIENGVCELRKMYVHPGHRGKGLGKKLLEHALHKAGELGFSCIVLETASVLKEAIHLYKKYGFEPYEADHLSERCDQAYIRRLDVEQIAEGDE